MTTTTRQTDKTIKTKTSLVERMAWSHSISSSIILRGKGGRYKQGRGPAVDRDALLTAVPKPTID